MSKADEMFEKLGYKKKLHVDYKTEKITLIGYTKNEKDRIEDCSIIFLVANKHITFSVIVDIQELQAINEKVKELGWL